MLFTIENHVNLALISLTIAPSTFLALTIVIFTYLYIIHVRNNPLPRPAINHDHGDNRGARRPVRRPSIFRRITTRLRTRTRKQRARPVAPLWISFSSLWLPLRHRLGDRGFGIRRQIQSAGLETRGKRTPLQRLLE
jgi:hypothetical protein